MKSPPKEIILALRDFAMPAPRTGSIHASSGSARAAAEGREIQMPASRSAASKPIPSTKLKCASAGPSNEPGSGSGSTAALRCSGTRNVRIGRSRQRSMSANLQRRFPRPPAASLRASLLTSQLLLSARRGGHSRTLFYLVSTRSRESLDIELALDLPRYEQWLETRLEELVLEAKKAEKRAKRRRKMAAAFRFPYENPRPGQVELMQTVEQGIAGKQRMLIQGRPAWARPQACSFPC